LPDVLRDEADDGIDDSLFVEVAAAIVALIVMMVVTAVVVMTTATAVMMRPPPAFQGFQSVEDFATFSHKAPPPNPSIIPVARRGARVF
jgi:hypothetical protein